MRCRAVDGIIVGTDQSAALRAANQRLHALRASMGISAETRPLPSPTESTRQDGQVLPDHLGWGSATITAVVRAARARQAKQAISAEVPAVAATEADAPTPSLLPKPSTHVKLHPSLALAMLREKQTAAGRLWLLLRHLDAAGQGAVRIATIRETFCDKTSPLRVCGWRQMRNLLRAGQGLFWQRDAERVWLRSVTKVAAGLGVVRLQGWPVALPVTALTGTIGTVRAHFYASFHTGRQREGREAMPIARETLEQLSGVDRRSQRLYEQRVGLAVRTNVALGERASAEMAHERAWELGRALFHFVDSAGLHGRAGATYLARQLPNSYGRCHQLDRRGRQKRINRDLRDLFAKGMTGNGQGTIERRYFVDGHAAAQQRESTAFWQLTERQRMRAGVWISAE